ncbi:MAG: TonB-dependent receptor [Sphingomicrobium sp.]
MTNTAHRACRQLLASVALLAMSAPGWAQNPDQSPAQRSQAADEAQPDEIIVTAQKREESLQDVPISVTVVGGATLERQQATNFQDYLSLVPGFSLESDTAGVSRITLRGANTGGVASTVAVFMDEVPFGSSTGLANGAILSGDFDPFDLARIEVLRGPQGTLYGAASFGGVLKYVTNAPRLGHFEARAQAGVESTKGGGLGHNAAAVLNAPLGDKAAVRVSGFWREDPGFVNSIGNNPLLNLLTGAEIGRTLIADDINGRKSYGGRASLLFQPSDALSVRLTAFAQNLNSSGSGQYEVDPDTFKPLYGGLVQSIYQREPTKVKYRVYSATADWDLGFANVLSSTAYSTFSEKLERDLTFSLGGLINLLANLGPDVGLLGLPPSFIIADPAVTRPLGVHLFQQTATDKFTQEVRLSSPDNDKLEWLAGLFYTNEKSGINPQNLFATEFNTNTPAAGVSQIAAIFLDSKYDEYAAFANATWHIAPRFDLTLGGRLAHNKQKADLLINSDVLGNAQGTGLDSSETVFTYSVAPRFELSDDASIYARVATGYRPGGPNAIPAGSPPGTPATYDSDRLTSWELGFKAKSPNSRLWSFEAAAYHLDWKDIQLFAIVNDTGINANGGKAKVDGIELSGVLRPVHGLTFSANGAYTRAKLKDDTPPATGGLAGDPLPWSPKWSGALHGDYEFPVGAAEGFVGGSINRVGKRVANLNERTADNEPVRIPGYTDVDLRAGVNFDHFTVQAFARNLFNKRGITAADGFNGATYPNGAAAVAIIRPRTIGLTVTANFGQ